MMLTLTTGDTAPALTGTVSADLTGATVLVHLKRPDRTALVKPATVTDPTTGAWETAWEVGDLSQAGAHYVEVQVTFSDDTIQTFALDATGQFIKLLVREQIA